MESNLISAAAVDRLEAPTAILKNDALSTLTSMFVEWPPVAPGVSPGGDVLGYRLRVEDAINGTIWIVFDGQQL